MDRDKIIPTLVVFGGICTVFFIIVTWITEMDRCYEKKGVLVNTFFGYDCVEPKK